MMEFLSLKELHRLPPLPQDQTSASLRYLTATTTAAQRLRAMGQFASQLALRGQLYRAGGTVDQAARARLSMGIAWAKFAP